jgi:hypothetical protein
MKMAKRVSKSRPWDLNRNPYEIELLDHISDHQTLWHMPSDRPTQGLRPCHGHSHAAMLPIKQSRPLPPMIKQSRINHHGRTQAIEPAVGLHIGRVWHSPVRSREGKTPQTLVRRRPSDSVVSSTLPRVAPTFTHTGDTEWTVRAISLMPPRAPVRCRLLSSRTLGSAVWPSQRPIRHSVKQRPIPLFQPFSSANTSPLLKCVNHQVYHLMHMC